MSNLSQILNSKPVINTIPSFLSYASTSHSGYIINDVGRCLGMGGGGGGGIVVDSVSARNVEKNCTVFQL